MTEAYSIQGFCEAHHISRATFYNLIREGRGPRLMRPSPNRVLVSRESAAEWRRQLEAEAPAAAPAAAKRERARTAAKASVEKRRG